MYGGCHFATLSCALLLHEIIKFSFQKYTYFHSNFFHMKYICPCPWRTDQTRSAPRAWTRQVIPHGHLVSFASKGTHSTRVVSPWLRGAIFVFDVHMRLELLIRMSTIPNAPKTLAYIGAGLSIHTHMNHGTKIKLLALWQHWWTFDYVVLPHDLKVRKINSLGATIPVTPSVSPPSRGALASWSSWTCGPHARLSAPFSVSPPPEPSPHRAFCACLWLAVAFAAGELDRVNTPASDLFFHFQIKLYLLIILATNE